jgi:hypothetical protein
MSFHGPEAPKIQYPSSRTTKKQVSLATFRRKDSDGKFVPVRVPVQITFKMHWQIR